MFKFSKKINNSEEKLTKITKDQFKIMLFNKQRKIIYKMLNSNKNKNEITLINEANIKIQNTINLIRTLSEFRCFDIRHYCYKCLYRSLIKFDCFKSPYLEEMFFKLNVEIYSEIKSDKMREEFYKKLLRVKTFNSTLN